MVPESYSDVERFVIEVGFVIDAGFVFDAGFVIDIVSAEGIAVETTSVDGIDAC
jgi:hypothetical protein